MRSKGYSNAAVCVCARFFCSRFNSLYDDLFGPQTIPPTQQVTGINLMEGFFLKRLRYRDTSSTASVQLTTVGHF